jgi:hypothetical protein
MWRSRARFGLCVIVMALAWAFALAWALAWAFALAWPAVAVAGVVPPGTPRVSPATAPAFPYTFAAALAGTAHPAIDWMPILPVVIGLVLVAGTAGLAAFRPLRRGERKARGSSAPDRRRRWPSLTQGAGRR